VDHDEKLIFPQRSLTLGVAIFAISVAQVEKQNLQLFEFSSFYLHH
jgi:hypothetical protein